MEKNLRENLLRVCNILNKHRIEYLVVGGIAVALHGYFRKSISDSGFLSDKPDLDFWYNPTYQNYFRLLNAIEELGQDVSEFRKEKTPNPKKSFFKLKFESVTIDFLPELPGLSKFSNSYSKKETGIIGDIEISFIDFDDLVTNKQTTARDKDVADIEQLKMIRKSNEL